MALVVRWGLCLNFVAEVEYEESLNFFGGLLCFILN